MRNLKRLAPFIGLVLLAGLLLTACGPLVFHVPVVPPTLTPVVVRQPTATVAPLVQPTAQSTLSDREVATLNSLTKVDDFPLYTMHYYGTSAASSANTPSVKVNLPRTWACSLFAALDGDNQVYGRNFDWVDSPALLLFNHPIDGYASVSMVDLAYLGFGDQIDHLTDLPLERRGPLLDAPAWPFDGMNERGLVVGMAAGPDGSVPLDPAHETIDSLWVMRLMLDHAADVDEAVAVLERYNIDWGSGPALHYLIADRAGRAVLVEFYQGKMRVMRMIRPGIWQRTS